MADYSLLEKYEAIRYRFKEVGSQITDPGVMSDMKRYVKLIRNTNVWNRL